METIEPASPARAAWAPGDPRLLRLWGGGVLLMVLLYVVIDLHLPVRELAFGIPLDVALHFTCFTCLAAMSLLAFARVGSALAAILFLLALGMFLEITQYYMPHRFFSLMDAGANALGLSLGALLGFPLRRLSLRTH